MGSIIGKNFGDRQGTKLTIASKNFRKMGPFRNFASQLKDISATNKDFFDSKVRPPSPLKTTFYVKEAYFVKFSYIYII